MYSDRLIDHFRNPRFVGHLDPPAVSVQVENPACGDILHLSAVLDGDVVREVRYRTRGCTASIAAGSALCEWMIGRTRSDLASLEPGVIEDALGGLANESRHAAVLCRDAVRALLKESGPNRKR
jgi:nitrogen fixation NifU-like protein